MDRRKKGERQRLYKSPSYRELQSRVADTLRSLRSSRGWTQEQAAARCEMSTRLYQRCEAGDANLTLTSLARLCTGYEVDINEIFGERER